MTPRNERAQKSAVLMQRIAGGDGDALGELYDDYAPLLLALSRRILGTAEEAEDVVQEVFVQVWNQANRYDVRRSSVSTWLVLITRSRSIDRLRSRKVGDNTVEKVARENPDAYASAKGVGNVLHHQRHIRLRRELDLLPAEQRQVLDLAFFRGLTQSEIARETGVPLGTVKTRTLLAMKKLRKSLASEIEELL